MFKEYIKEYRDAENKEEFIYLVQKRDKKIKKSTIERDYYRLKKFIKSSPVEAELKGMIHLKRLKILDMIKFKVKINEFLLRKEGFDEDEIKNIMRMIKDG